MRVFEYVIVEHVSKKQRDQGEQDRIVAGPKTVLAHDEQAASMLAGREIPEDLLPSLDRVEVAVRPF